MTPSTHRLFSMVPAPPDPILGLQGAFKADTSPDKVNLGVGVYLDESGVCPLFEAVRAAQNTVVERGAPKTYLPIDGHSAYSNALRDLIAPVLSAVQTLGGTGALRVAAELMALSSPRPKIWLTHPTWANHRPIFETAGLPVDALPYVDRGGQQLDSAGLLNALDELGPDDVVVMHGCCHNPTGIDPDPLTWRMIARIAQARGWLPLVDLAYVGLGAGIERDLLGVRTLASANVPMMVAVSCSKIFGLYGERIGALMLQAHNNEAAVRSHIKRIIRRLYSNPPSHGAMIVADVLSKVDLRQQWMGELTDARQRVQQMRFALADALHERRPDDDFSYMTQQQGMFSLLPLTPAGVEKLQQEWHVYMPRSGRINFAGLTSVRVEYVADALHDTLSPPSSAVA